MINELLAGTHEFAHDGEVYKVSLITQEVKATWEQRVLDREMTLVKRTRDLLDDDEYRAEVEQVRKNYRGGKYAFESEVSKDYLATKGGVTYLVSLLFGVSENAADELLLARIDDVKDLLGLVFEESYPEQMRQIRGEQTAKKR